MHYFSQSSIFCVHPSAAAGLRQDFVNDRNGEIRLCVTLPCIKEIRSMMHGKVSSCIHTSIHSSCIHTIIHSSCIHTSMNT